MGKSWLLCVLMGTLAWGQAQPGDGFSWSAGYPWNQGYTWSEGYTWSDGHPVSSPFDLLAIGDPDQLGPAADLSASSLQTRVQVTRRRDPGSRRPAGRWAG